MKKRKFSTCFPMTRIKKIIQADEDIGRVSSATPAVLSACVEIFLKEICTKSVETTRSKGSNLLIPSHVESCVSENASFSFLKQTVKEQARSSEKRSKASLGMDVVEENSTNSQKNSFKPQKSLRKATNKRKLSTTREHPNSVENGESSRNDAEESEEFSDAAKKTTTTTKFKRESSIGNSVFDEDHDDYDCAYRT